MRVLRLGVGEEGAVDLHPAVSVVTGLTDRQRNALRRGFTAIGTGLSPRTAGLLEAHSLLLDATQDDLDLLEVPSTPASTVSTPVEVAGVLPDDDAERLRTVERDLLLLAGDRWRARQDLERAAASEVPVATHGDGRAAELQSRIARHDAQDAESVRMALDQARDATRAGTTPDRSGLVDALRRVGLDTTDFGLHADELVQLAEDWVDEHRREADAVVGAQVELQGIESAGRAQTSVERVLGGRDRIRQRAASATARHAEAVVRADDLRTELLRRHGARADAETLGVHLAARLSAHRPARLAGAVPLLLDGVLEHLGEGEATTLLDRLSALAGSVQLVVVDEHPAATVWAESVGILRAAIVGPVPAAAVQAAT